MKEAETEHFPEYKGNVTVTFAVRYFVDGDYPEGPFPVPFVDDAVVTFSDLPEYALKDLAVCWNNGDDEQVREALNRAEISQPGIL